LNPEDPRFGKGLSGGLGCYTSGNGTTLSGQTARSGEQGSRGDDGREGLPSKIHNFSSNEVERGSYGRRELNTRLGLSRADPAHVVSADDRPPPLRAADEFGECRWVREAIEASNQRQEPWS
jgi:hypothetical protein